MLVLTRKEGEAVWIGDVRVVVCQVKGGRIRLGIAADKDISVKREELRNQQPEQPSK